MNNNADNKCLLHKSGVLSGLVSLKGLVDVLETDLTSLLAFMDEKQDEVVTACHQTISLSKALNGDNSDVVSIWGSLIFSSRYIPLGEQELMVALFSGGSNYEEKLRNKNGWMLTSRKLGVPSKGIKNINITTE